MNPDETALYVAMTRGNAIWRLQIHPDGSTAKVGVFAQMAGGVSGADGLAGDGSLAVADAGNGCVWIFSQWAEPLQRVITPTAGRTTTNLAYGGPDRTQIFVTASATGTILIQDMPVEGWATFGVAQ